MSASSSIRTLKKRALELIRMGDKVYHYRKDVISVGDIATLRDTTAHLESLYRNKSATADDLEDTIRQQHSILTKTGGKIYPNGFLNENIETILVVAIVIIAFRIFFFQPFVIPTNSMYPTYSGMQPQTYELGEKSPNTLQKVATLLFRGGRHHEIVTQNSGEILIPLRSNQIRPEIVPGKKWFILPTKKQQFTINVDDVAYKIQGPLEFSLRDIVIDTYGISTHHAYEFRQIGEQYYLRTGKFVKQGDVVLQFDVLMGDALFVNRFWYHFAKPKSGDAIVFRTRDFMDRTGYPSTVGEDKFYIKRLTGEPGMTLEVKDFRLYQDGQPASGATAFEKNATQEGEYPGYRNVGLLELGETFTVPEEYYFGMGDNSSNSKDCRYFGPVPEKDIIGAASFIYYPFTKRWGPAQ